MPEIEVVDVENPAGEGAILVSVPPPDGPTIASALRDRGFVVVDCPVNVLAATNSSSLATVLIVDIDEAGAMEAIEGVRERGVGPEVLYVGDPDSAVELGIRSLKGRSFERPIDIEALLEAVGALADPIRMDSRGALLRETTPPCRVREGEAAPPPDEASAAGAIDAANLLPPGEEAYAVGRLVAAELSPELAGILQAAEQRVRALGKGQGVAARSPDEELDLLLPPELLAALDDPLDPEEDPEEGGAPLGGGTGHGDGGSSRLDGEVQTAAVATTGARGDKGSRSQATSDVAVGLVVARTAGSPVVDIDSPLPLALAQRGTRLAAISPEPPGASGSSAPPPALTPPPGTHPGAVTPGYFGPEPRGSAAPRAEVGADVPWRRPPSDGPDSRGELPTGTAGIPDVPALASVTFPSPSPARRAVPAVDAVLGDGDAVRAIARLIVARASGALAVSADGVVRRIVLHEGDIVTAGSDAIEETLVAFLVARGDLARDVAARVAGKLPPFGRHAGAALIAHGHLSQDELWPVLRAHAEWVIGRVLLTDRGTAELELEAPARLRAEPNVFGGATGAEVLIEAVRRVIPPALAFRRLGGARAMIAEGPQRQLLAECALLEDEDELVRTAPGRSVGEIIEGGDPELADMFYALSALSVIEVIARADLFDPAQARSDPLDAEALRKRVRTRVALVEDGDYFALLGVPHAATGYEVRRAYLDLRRAFDPKLALTAATADLAEDLRLVAEVLDEAYEILRDPDRRERYRRAIEAGPP